MRRSVLILSHYIYQVFFKRANEVVVLVRVRSCLVDRSILACHEGPQVDLLSNDSLVQTVNVPAHEHNSNSENPSKDLGGRWSSTHVIQGGVELRNDIVDQFT